MLFEKTEKLFLEMNEKLSEINALISEDVAKLSSSLGLINNSLQSLKKLLEAEPIQNIPDEIYFFKKVKPSFNCWRIFIVEHFNIISNVPIDTDEAVRNYYLRELDFIKRYFDQNQFLYQYYLKNESSLDQQYFLRKEKDLTALGNRSENFETNHDYTFAKFLAYEKLRSFLIKRVRLLYQNPENSVALELLNGHKLRWTDDKVNLVELAYGIYFMGSINNGKADISDIVEWLEKSLNIDMGVAYRKFIDISRRKNKSFTRYIDEMRQTITDHINENQRYRQPALKK